MAQKLITSNSCSFCSSVWYALERFGDAPQSADTDSCTLEQRPRSGRRFRIEISELPAVVRFASLLRSPHRLPGEQIIAIGPGLLLAQFRIELSGDRDEGFVQDLESRARTVHSRVPQATPCQGLLYQARRHPECRRGDVCHETERAHGFFRGG